MSTTAPYIPVLYQPFKPIPILPVSPQPSNPGITVTTASDVAGHSGTSLRDAIATANTDAGAGRSDTITFDPSLAGATITLTAQLELSGAGGGTITIDGSSLSSPVVVSGNNASRVFQVDKGVQAILNGLSIEGGKAPPPGGDSIGFTGSGGGISNAGTLTMSNATVSGNQAGNSGAGGGIYNTGSLTVTNSTIASNSAGIAGGGGGISNGGTALVSNSTFSANSAGDGGGIANGGALMVSSCTFTFNSASDPFDSGGGGGGLFTNSTALVINSTFYGNSAGSGTAGNYGDGGAINGGTAVINCTIYGNSASGPTAYDFHEAGNGGGLYSTGLVLNTIVAGNTATGSGGVAPPTALQQQGVPTGNTAGNNDLIGGDPMLAPLGNYGGPTQTMPPLPGSPAIGAGGAVGFIAVGVDAASTTITLPSASVFVTTALIPTPIQIDSEQMLVTGLSGSILTVVRGYNGTTPAAHGINASFYLATDQRGFPRGVGGVVDIGAVEGTAGPPPSTLGYVASSLSHSGEYYADFITAAYQKYLGRTPAAGEVAGWVTTMQNGLTDEHLEADFIGAPEYIADHGGKYAAWVQGMYVDLLGRTPEQSEVDGWVQALSNGMTPAQVAYGFAASAERETERISGDYQKYLGRTPNPSEVPGWVNAFESGLRNEDVIAGFVGSVEDFQAHYNDNAEWLISAYQAILGRTPDNTTLQSWLAVLAS